MLYLNNSYYEFSVRISCMSLYLRLTLLLPTVQNSIFAMLQTEVFLFELKDSVQLKVGKLILKILIDKALGMG